jgi:hypothetical protein
MVNLFLLVAIILCVFGLGWLALAMDVHWKQVRTDQLSAARVKIMRCLGSVALLASFLFCLAVDHVSMASLVWIMLLAASALTIAFTLSWYPRLLSPLIVWIRVVK